MYNKNGIFCLENIWSSDIKDKSSVLPILELIEKSIGCPYIYHNCATRGELDYMLAKWKKKSIQNKYPILYFGFHGTKEGIQLHEKNEVYKLCELGETLKEACRGKIIFLASCSTLNVNDETIKSFLKLTSALAIIGYKTKVPWMLSASFELMVLHNLQLDKFDGKGISKIKRQIEKQCESLINVLKVKIIVTGDNWITRPQIKQ